uniref:Uncharacterized protein n=1 Tax=Anguilla anguilla TaxID=7936 RepID=A0A0E9TMG7_ANGAN
MIVRHATHSTLVGLAGFKRANQIWLDGGGRVIFTTLFCPSCSNPLQVGG